ncbi:MAG: DUF2934 domain-containing protein [Thiocapsa sp.]|jgi:hypothetical protein|nr:DUF2934 domain-containing protein [Thiocapsa sp.]MCG6986377.1 DUF2934 domain-containing protein [Thiocapsa sp.]
MAPTAEQRHEMIAIAAYYLAERRGFAPGGADEDWLRAERVIDRMIRDHLFPPSPADVVEGIRNALKLSTESSPWSQHI